MLGVLSSTSLIFFNNFFFTTSINFFKSIVINLSGSNSANWSISNLSTFDFKLPKSSFLANLYVSTPVAFLKVGFCCIIRQI